MILEIENGESVLAAIARETGGRISIHLDDARHHLYVGDEHSHEVLKLDRDQVMDLIEELTELVSHMEED